MGYARSPNYWAAPPPPKNLHSAADVPKKVEKTSSENITFVNSEHPYRTSGPSAASFDFLRSLFFDQKLIIPLRTSPKKSKKTSSEKHTFTKIEHPYRTCGSGGMIFALLSVRVFFFFFKKYRRFDPLAQNRSTTYHSVADVPKKSKKRQATIQLL